ncbi:MAG: flagellar synthesis protein [Pseudoduganella sp.]|nr:flagellar synthesis protein [Pseudoduganella sp.]
MTNVEVLSAYSTMAALTHRMVGAATAADWDGLEGLEREVAAHVALLRDSEAAVLLVTMPWMAQLSKLINNTGTERRLAAAYGAV